MSRSRLVLVLIATVAVSMVLGGVAVAVTAPKTLSACTTKSHGVRVLATAVKCHKGEKKLTWRIRGRDGAIGARGPKGDRGATGATGPAGAKGARGDAGPVGRVQNVSRVPATARLLSPAAGQVISATAPCAPGEQAIGGGFSLSDTADGQRDVVQQSGPYIDNNGIQGWVAEIIVVPPTSGVYHGVTAYAMCVAT